MPIDIIIAPKVGGFDLNTATLEQLYTRHPELFGEPHPLAELISAETPVPGPGEDQTLFANALIKGDLVYFLDLEGRAARTNPWLLEKLRNEGSSALTKEGYSRFLKIVSIPDDVNWFVYTDSGGVESVHEHARVWR